MQQRLLDEVHVISTPTWLPDDSGVEWLDALGADHRRMLAARSEAAGRRTRTVALFEGEDERHRAVLEAGIRTGEPADPPAMTPPDQRRAALADLDDMLAAANRALEAFAREAIAELEQHADELVAAFAAVGADAAEKRREAERLLAEASAAEARSWQLQHWVQRNGGIHPRRAFRTLPQFRFLGWDQAAALRPPQPPVDDAGGFVMPQLVDTWPGAARHGESLNRGRVPSLAEITNDPKEKDE